MYSEWSFSAVIYNLNGTGIAIVPAFDRGVVRMVGMHEFVIGVQR